MHPRLVIHRWIRINSSVEIRSSWRRSLLTDSSITLIETLRSDLTRPTRIFPVLIGMVYSSPSRATGPSSSSRPDFRQGKQPDEETP